MSLCTTNAISSPKTKGGSLTNGSTHPFSKHADIPASKATDDAAYINGDTDLKFDTVEDTAAAFATGNFILMLDSTSRENEGDLIIAAEDITPAKMAFLIHHSSGLICTPLSAPITHTLALPQMVPESTATEIEGTAYTISVDATSTTTGISAYDRALTCKALSAPTVTASDFRRPGHVFPLRARQGGVRERRGHTEAAVDLCRLAGKREVGVLCEVVEEGGGVEGKTEREGAGMMRRDGCLRFGRRWGIRVCTIEMLLDYLVGRDGGR